MPDGADEPPGTDEDQRAETFVRNALGLAVSPNRHEALAAFTMLYDRLARSAASGGAVKNRLAAMLAGEPTPLGNPKLDRHAAELSTARLRIQALTAAASTLESQLTFANGQVATLRTALERVDAAPGREGARARQTGLLQGLAAGGLVCAGLAVLVMVRLPHRPAPIPVPAPALAQAPPPAAASELEPLPPRPVPVPVLRKDPLLAGSDDVTTPFAGAAKTPDTPAPLPAVQRPAARALAWTYHTPMGTGWKVERTPWPERFHLLVELPAAQLAVFRVDTAFLTRTRPELDRRVESLRAMVPPGQPNALFDIAGDGTVTRVAN